MVEVDNRYIGSAIEYLVQLEGVMHEKKQDEWAIIPLIGGKENG